MDIGSGVSISVYSFCVGLHIDFMGLISILFGGVDAYCNEKESATLATLWPMEDAVGLRSARDGVFGVPS